MAFFKKIFSCFQVSRDPNGQQSKKPSHRPRDTPFPGQLSSFGMTSAIDDIPSRLPNILSSFEVDSGNANSGQMLTAGEIDVGYSYTSEAESGEAIGEHADVHLGSRATLTKSRSDVCCSSTAEASINAELRRRALAIESLSVKTWGDIGHISGAESSNIGGLRGVLAEQARVGLGRQEFETDSLRFKNWDDESSDSGINTTPPQEDQEGVYSRAWARIVGPQQQEGRLTANITPRQDQDEIEEDVTEPTQGMA